MKIHDIVVGRTKGNLLWEEGYIIGIKKNGHEHYDVKTKKGVKTFCLTNGDDIRLVGKSVD